MPDYFIVLQFLKTKVQEFVILEMLYYKVKH